MGYQAATAAELLGVEPKNTETTLTLAYSVEKGLPVSGAGMKFAGPCQPERCPPLHLSGRTQADA